MSLLEILVASAIAAIVLAVGSKLLLSASKQAAGFEGRADLDQFKLHLISSVDCRKSFPSGKGFSCKDPGAVLSLQGQNGQLISGTEPTRQGAFAFRAECSDSKDGVVVRATRLTDAGTLTSTSPESFHPDPVTGERISWSDNRSLLFEQDVPLCSGMRDEGQPAVSESGQTTFDFPDIEGPACAECGNDNDRNARKEFSITLSAPSVLMISSYHTATALRDGTGNRSNILTSIYINGAKCANARTITTRLGPFSTSMTCLRSVGAGTHVIGAGVNTWGYVKDRVVKVQWAAVPQ